MPLGDERMCAFQCSTSEGISLSVAFRNPVCIQTSSMQLAPFSDKAPSTLLLQVVWFRLRRLHRISAGCRRQHDVLHASCHCNALEAMYSTGALNG